jgi:hypothetical protein
VQAAVSRKAFPRAYRSEVASDAPAALLAKVLERENMDAEAGVIETTKKGLTQ